MRNVALVTILVAVAAAAVVPTAAREKRPPLAVAGRVDLTRYAGLWYEIARLPNKYEKGCRDVTATYSLRPDGKIDVLNRCLREGGKRVAAKGLARVREGGSNATLEVRFAPAWLSFLPVWGDYNVLELAPDYSFALVGTRDRKWLWILSRTPTLDDSVYRSLVARAASLGFDTSRLERTEQAASAVL